MTAITTVKCTDCGFLWKNKGSLQELGILEGNNCPNCGGEVILLPHHTQEHP
jgi:DNA-directed RNA polymerase subunit RPC12/RpoP